jgi:hypothetical protein
MVNIKTTSQNLSPKPIPWKKAYNSTLPKNINIIKKCIHQCMNTHACPEEFHTSQRLGPNMSIT